MIQNINETCSIVESPDVYMKQRLLQHCQTWHSFMFRMSNPIQ